MTQSLGAKAVISRSRPYKYWTPDDSAHLRRLVQSGMTDARIGEEMGRHPNFIRAKRKERGLQPGQSQAFTAMMTRINYRRFRLQFQNAVQQAA